MNTRTLFLTIALFVTGQAVLGQEVMKDALRKSLESLDRPKSKDDFKPAFHLTPINQDTTLICWSFATSSFIETEMERLGMEPVRLSVVYPVYAVFQEKAKTFIATKGKSRFAAGDLFTGVLDIIQEYGAMPADAYRGSTNPDQTYNHGALYAELDKLMTDVRKNARWDENVVLPEVRKILDKHLGAPPKEFSFKDRENTSSGTLK